MAILKRRTKLVIMWITLFTTLCLGIYVWWETPNPSKVPKEPFKDVPVVRTTTETKTTMAYVPKATPQDADIEYITEHKPITVKVNGVTQRVENEAIKEEQKFENGKLVVTQHQQGEIHLVIPEQPKIKKGVYYEQDLSTHMKSVGVRISYQTKPIDIDLKADVWANKSDDKRITLTATKWL